MNKKNDDSNLIERMKAGDNTAFSDLYSLYFPVINNYIINQGGQRDDAQDIFSEAVLAIFQHAKREDFFLTVSLKTYLFAICQRRWINEAHKMSRRKVILKADFSESKLEEKENPLSILEDVDNKEFLMKALGQIGERCKMLLSYYSQNYSMAEIAQIQGYSSPDMVKKELYRCRIRLREFLATSLKKSDEK